MSDSRDKTVTVRFFGKLHTLRAAAGLPDGAEASVPEGGAAAKDILADFGLPSDEVEGVFVNHTVHPLSHVVMPGDRIAFVPRGTPGPHRFTLGLFSAGREEKD